MKKENALVIFWRVMLFAAIILLLVSLTGCNSKAEAIEDEEPFVLAENDLGPYKVVTLEAKSECGEASVLSYGNPWEKKPTTSQYLRSLTWEQMKQAQENFKTREDTELKWLIHVLDKPQSKQYISSVNGLVRMEASNYEEMQNKFQAVIDAYNKSCSPQVKLYTERVEDEADRMVVQVISTNDPVVSIGQKALLKDISFFYESSKNFGSGKSGVSIEIIDGAFADNPLLPEDYIVMVNGVSYLSKSGNIQESLYFSPEEVRSGEVNVPIDTSRLYMLQICDGKKDIGWVLPEAVMSIN